MRHLFVALLAGLLSTSQAEAQLTARDAGIINRAARQQQEQKEGQEQQKKIGEQLFGVPTVELRGGTAQTKRPEEWQVGDWGLSGDWMMTMDVVSPTELLVSYNGGRVVFLIRGVSTTNITDDKLFIFPHPFAIDDTYSYETVSEGGKRVLVLDVTKYPARLEALKAAEEEALYRTWTVAGEEVLAKYTSFESGKVTLTLKDKTMSVVSIADLSQDDKAIVAKERKRVAAAKAEADKQERIRKRSSAEKR